jgi:hypothetical protein
MFSNFSPQKLCRLLDNVEKYDRARQAADTESEYLILIAFALQQW